MLGTSVLLPALRHPILLAHQVATLDQVSGGRLILGVGIAMDLPSIRSEFAAADVPWEKRVGRMIEGLNLCRAFWTGEPVEWNGRWTVRNGIIGPTPHRPGGPPIWCGGMVHAALERVARHFDGWLPNGPQPPKWGEDWAELRALARGHGRNPDELVGAVYVTLAIDADADRAERRVGSYLERYYGQPADLLRRHHTYYAGPVSGLADWLSAYGEAGVSHFVLRFAGDHERHLENVAKVRADLGWKVS
jgi:alkanesulfonate monooxygenase SsuD/methylene tetrahydromethanopterin reductase-like flavin-dependent oxidoreductase (luciferase family)